jgi:signal recognition particle subunit SRP54
VVICQQALEEAKKRFCDVLLIDTAGRLHIDEELMQELAALKQTVRPHHILFVADSMTGQDAVNQAVGFDGKLGITGIILTKLDGDARGGAALSIRETVGKPILFSGVGEKLEALEPFYPDRLASRILGMGDVLSLIDKVQQNVEQKEAARLQKAFQKQQFTLEEFQIQLQQIKRMGSMNSLLEMIPGGKKLASQVDADKAEKELKRVEAIINSMTLEERRNPAILNGSRRRRIAQGSGTTVTDINRLMKQFMEMKKMMQRVNKMGVRSLFSRMPNPFQ